MLNELQPDIRELIDPVRQAERYDATLAASRNSGTPIDLLPEAEAECKRKTQPILYLGAKCYIYIREEAQQYPCRARRG